MSEFLSYRETRQLLADKFNATQESMAFEIAAWIWLRSLVAYQNSEELGDDGLVFGDRDRFYFDAKGLETQSFDYFPKLEGCYFKRADVEGFEPQDRYINGVALVQRWAAVCSGEDGARAKIRSCCPQRLTDYFPGYGGTQASVNQCDYALWPPFEMALFSLRQVSAIEIEDFGNEVVNMDKTDTAYEYLKSNQSIPKHKLLDILIVLGVNRKNNNDTLNNALNIGAFKSNRGKDAKRNDKELIETESFIKWLKAKHPDFCYKLGFPQTVSIPSIDDSVVSGSELVYQNNFDELKNDYLKCARYCVSLLAENAKLKAENDELKAELKRIEDKKEATNIQRVESRKLRNSLR